jgi:hypothetical protein
MLQTTTGSCTRKYAQAQTRNNAGTNPQQRRHKIRNTCARNVKNAQNAQRQKPATVKTRNKTLQTRNGKTSASIKCTPFWRFVGGYWVITTKPFIGKPFCSNAFTR